MPQPPKIPWEDLSPAQQRARWESLSPERKRVLLDREREKRQRARNKRTDPTARMMPTKAKKPKRTVTSKEDVKHQLKAGARQTGQAIRRGFSRMTPIGPLRRRSR